MTEVQLADEILRLALELQRLSANEEREAEAILRELTEDLERLLNSGTLSGRTKDSIEGLIDEAQRAITARYATVATQVDTRGLVVLVADRTVEALKIIAPEVAKVTPETLASLADEVLIDGAPSADWWAKQAEDTSFKFAGQVRQGVINGETNERIVQRIVGKRGEPGIMDVARRNARTLVHSSVMTAANDARLASFRANSRFIKGVRWLSTLDSRSCLRCAALDRSAWSLDGEKLPGTTLQFAAPPAHFSCFPGDTLVSAARPITGASKRWFDGEVVVLKTAAGRELTCTPNHPILTDWGWVAADLLDVGSNIVADSIGQREGAVHGDRKDAPAGIHHVAEAFLASREMLAVPVKVAAEDFHGDGLGSHVAVVWSDRLLESEAYALCFEHGGKPSFVDGGAAGLIDLAGESGLAQVLDARPLTANGVMGRGGKGLALPAAEALHPGELLTTSVPHGDALLVEAGDKCVSGRAKLLSNSSESDALLVELDRLGEVYFTTPRGIDTAGMPGAPQSNGHCVNLEAALVRNLLSAFAGKVHLDEVVSADRRAFAGHVYNLETEGGWYTANGLFVHNCRCVLSPIPKSESDDGPAIGQRASSEGPVEAGTTFDAFLKRQSPEFIERVLGKRRAELYAAGKITLRDLVSGTGRELTLDEIR